VKRREFITLLGGAAVAGPIAARAQKARKVPVVGFLGQSTPLGESERAAAFAQRLRELGWVEGRTIAIEYRWAAGRNERLAEIAAEFVQLKIDAPHRHHAAILRARDGEGETAYWRPNSSFSKD
jgi:putative ABC transport system substrate-binding protein